ncbi:hypothetical protein D3C85_1047810 [compost metagenome]
MADVLAVEPALQVRVMATVFTFDDALGQLQGFFIDPGVVDHRQQQVEYLALVARRGFDDEGGVGTAGIGIPLPAQCLHAFFQAALAAVVDAAEQQVFKQVRQLLALAGEVIEANTHHQANRHMAAFITRLEHHLQTIGQQVAFDLGAVDGEAGRAAQQQANEHQATHGELPCGSS